MQPIYEREFERVYIYMRVCRPVEKSRGYCLWGYVYRGSAESWRSGGVKEAGDAVCAWEAEVVVIGIRYWLGRKKMRSRGRFRLYGNGM